MGKVVLILSNVRSVAVFIGLTFDQNKIALAAIDTACSFHPKGYFFSRKYKLKLWDGKVHLFYRESRSFPTGLIEIVKQALMAKNIEYEVKDERIKPKTPLCPLEIRSPFVLRDYQQEAIDISIEKTRGILWIATNGGKTLIASGIIQRLNVPTLYLLHRKELLYQTQSMIERYTGIKAGTIGDGGVDIKQVTVGMVQTLGARKSEFKNFLNTRQLLIIDETHHAPAEVWQSVVNSCWAYYRFGMSGTPLKRQDGSDLTLIGSTGQVLYKVSNQQLKELGVSAEATITYIPVDCSNVRDSTYKEAYSQGIVLNPLRNNTAAAKAIQCFEKGLLTLVLIKEIQHGTILDQLIPRAIPHAFIHGSLDTNVRNTILKRFAEGKIKILISSVILDEGVDVPEIGALILAGGGNSEIKALQRVGRGLRRGASGKLWVYDFYDKGNRYLQKHSNDRRKEYLNDGAFEVATESS